MPVPLTTATLAFSAILALMGADISAVIVGAAGTINQALATWATSVPSEDY